MDQEAWKPDTIGMELANGIPGQSKAETAWKVEAIGWEGQGDLEQSYPRVIMSQAQLGTQNLNLEVFSHGLTMSSNSGLSFSHSSSKLLTHVQ